MKKILFILSLVALTFLTGCGKEEAEDKVYTLKVGMAVGDKDPMYQGGLKLKEKVEARTDGKLIIELFPSGQLGSAEDLQEQAKLGANVAVITDSGRMGEFVKEIGVVGVAYIADDYEEMKKVIETDAFKEWEDMLRAEGFRSLAFNWFQGSRHFMTNKKVETPNDLNGLLIRTPGAPVWFESVNAMGATPTALPFNEVYPAMQQNVIDGFEAQIPAVYAGSLHEAIKYIARTDHFQLMTTLIAGESWMNSLPKEYQEILLEEAKIAGEYASKLTNDQIKEYEKIMVEDFGVEIVEVDKGLFKENINSVVEKLGYLEEYNLIKEQIN